MVNQRPRGVAGTASFAIYKLYSVYMYVYVCARVVCAYLSSLLRNDMAETSTKDKLAPAH